MTPPQQRPGVLFLLVLLDRNQRRVMFGLGTGWLDRLRWLWLKQLGPRLPASQVLFVSTGRPAE